MTEVFLHVSSDALYYTQDQTSCLNHLIMNSVMSDTLRLEIFKRVICYPLLHPNLNFQFKSSNHEVSHV
jgi:hypothetical protein